GPGKMCLVDADCTFGCKADKTCADRSAATDCGGTESEGKHRTCTAGVCGIMTDAAGTVLTVQTTGDCKRRVCAADGSATMANDDTDRPNHQNTRTHHARTTENQRHTI